MTSRVLNVLCAVAPSDLVLFGTDEAVKVLLECWILSDLPGGLCQIYGVHRGFGDVHWLLPQHFYC